MMTAKDFSAIACAASQQERRLTEEAKTAGPLTGRYLEIAYQLRTAARLAREAAESLAGKEGGRDAG